MASLTALHQRDIQPPEPRIIHEGPLGRVTRIDATSDDDERITFENLNRASFRRLMRDPLVLEVVPLHIDAHVKASKRTIKRRSL